jgi:uncharacterized protein (DUF433 family)
MSNAVQISWEECGLVERVEGKMGGRPVIKGMRVQPEIIVKISKAEAIWCLFYS